MTIPEDTTQLRQLVVAVLARLDLVELELALYKSQNQRSKSAWTYLEEAVAAEYGLEPAQLMSKPSKPGRPKGNVLPDVRQAQFLLFAILNGALGVPVYDIRMNYKPFVANYIAFWGELYNLVHKPRSLAGKDLRDWETYAPRFLGVYNRWKAAMLADGVWQDVYEDDFVNDLQPA